MSSGTPTASVSTSTSPEDAAPTRTGAESGAAGDDHEGLERAVYWVRVTAYTLAFLLALSVLVVGTVAVIAEVKDTWHWAIHLESTISYIGVAIAALLVPLVPLLLVSVAARVVYDV